MSSSFSLARGLNFLHRSIVNRVLALLNVEVKELIIADIITANKRPRNPGILAQFLDNLLYHVISEEDN